MKTTIKDLWDRICEKEKKKCWDALSGEEKAEEKCFCGSFLNTQISANADSPTWKFILSEAVLEIRFS